MLKKDSWLKSNSIKLAKIKEDLKTAEWEPALADRKSVGQMIIKNIKFSFPNVRFINFNADNCFNIFKIV